MQGVGAVRTGGRSARVRAAVLNATLKELLDHGYSGVRIARIAKTAGVHKTTIYRRWPNRESLVADLIAAQARFAIPVPDKGNVRDDLLHLARAVTRQIRSPVGGGLVRVLLAEADRHPEIRAIANQFWSTRFQLAGAIVQRSIERRELPPGTDPEQLMEALVSPLFMRTFLRFAPVNEIYLMRHVDLLLAAARTRPPTRRAR